MNKEFFKAQRKEAWAANTNYWLSSPLRHVEDVGNFIVERVEAAMNTCNSGPPVILDMGFGSAWLLERLISRNQDFEYIGLDNHEGFLAHARTKFRDVNKACFLYADIESSFPDSLIERADIVVNAFNFFELSDLSVPMANAAVSLKSDGKLLVATIDKTYLMMAGCDSWGDLVTTLHEYQEIQGKKYFFQAIDLGDRESSDLVYPSVLWSLSDFWDAGLASGLGMTFYKELVFTGKPIPKIYQYFEFEKKTSKALMTQHVGE